MFLTREPICSLLDGTDEACDGYRICDVCDQGVCTRHSDQQHPDGGTDPIHCDWGIVRHRACLEFV